MTDRFVDSTTGDNGDNGTTPTLAWATVEYALESGGLSAGYNIWARRVHSEIPVTDIAPVYDGSCNSPIQLIGWPRATVAGTATFTNGSTSVSSVNVSADRERHCGRRIKCNADGEWYLITRVVDTNTFTIDREYASATASGTAFTIQEDDDYDSRPQAGIDAGWDSDAHDIPLIDFNDANLGFYLSYDDYFVLKNFEFKDSSDIYGILKFYLSNAISVIGCLIKQTTQDKPLCVADLETIYFERVIWEGSGSGSGQDGLRSSYGIVHLKDCAVYNCGGFGVHLGYTTPASCFLQNVNIGVEMANGNSDLRSYKTIDVSGRDVKLGGTNGDVFNTNTYGLQVIAHFENYGKILGAHKAWFTGGTFEKAAVSGETPNKKLSDDIIKITPNTSGYEFITDWAVEIFCHEFEVDTTTRTWKYWIYNDAMGTINDITAKDNIWLKLEYVAKRDDDTEYVIKEVYSTEIDILNAANADDWDYLQVSGITPIIASKVRIKCYVSDYSATGHIYIDPNVVNP